LRILVAPQELKGSLSALEAAEAIARGLRRALADAAIATLPLADGGPGTLDALAAARGGVLRYVAVSDPLGRPVQARYGLIDDTAVIETAAANGLVLLRPEERDPARATTYGAGELIRAALDAGCRRLLLGIGGSATNDGGAGMAQALGFRLLDAHGAAIGRGAAPLAQLARIDAAGADPRLREAGFEVAVDVQNPLCGPQGATAVYGPQKGVQPEQVAALDAALRRLGETIERDLGVPVLDLPGAGAAGGLGAGLVGFLGARLRPGFAIVAEAVGLEARIAASDLIVTGEGRLDAQTPFGKTIAGVAALGKQHGVPVVALVGGIAPEFDPAAVAGLTAAVALTSRPLSLDEAQQDAAALLAGVAEQLGRLVGAFASGPRPRSARGR
jgi:glycerate kinase